MNKKKKIILAVIIVVIIVAVCNWAFNYIIDNLPANIYLRDNSIDEGKNLIIFKANRLLWDTGSTGSLLFRDIEHKKLRVGYSWNIDSEHTKRIDTLFFAKTLSTDSILLKNFIYSYIEKSNISRNLQNLNIIGILGMNVIKNYNWLLDFDKNTLQNYDKDFKIDTLTPKFVLTYSEDRKPLTDIRLGRLRIKKMLLDSGFYGDIMLYDSDIEVINKFITPDTIINDTSNSLYSDSIPVKRYVYYDVYINDLLFEKLTINEGKKRLIGIGFFRKFDRVFWDSGNREVRFYRD